VIFTDLLNDVISISVACGDVGCESGPYWYRSMFKDGEDRWEDPNSETSVHAAFVDSIVVFLSRRCANTVGATSRSLPSVLWYVRASVIVGCGPGGRVPAMDMAVLCCQAAIFFVVASYAPWSEVRQNFRDAPRLGAPFALGILGRLMTSVLATSGVVFNIFLLDILCSFSGIWSLSLRTYIPLESRYTTYVHSYPKR